MDVAVQKANKVLCNRHKGQELVCVSKCNAVGETHIQTSEPELGRQVDRQGDSDTHGQKIHKQLSDRH